MYLTVTFHASPRAHLHVCAFRSIHLAISTVLGAGAPGRWDDSGRLPDLSLLRETDVICLQNSAFGGGLIVSAPKGVIPHSFWFPD